MKGVVFTLDALFALIIAVASISIMLYFFYTPQVSYSFRYGEAASILSQLESTNLAYLAQSNRLANQMLALSNTQAASWPMLHSNNANNAGANFGPAYPFVSFIFYSSKQHTDRHCRGLWQYLFRLRLFSICCKRNNRGLKRGLRTCKQTFNQRLVIYYNSAGIC